MNRLEKMTKDQLLEEVRLLKSELSELKKHKERNQFVDDNTELNTTRDITSKKVAEQESALARKNLVKSEKKFRELFEKSSDAILIIENRKFTDCNNATVKLLNYSDKDKFLNVHPSKLSPVNQPDGRKSDEKADEMMAIAIENGTNRFEWDHLKSNGDVFPVEVLLTAISDEPDNEIIHVVWRDITERKKAEQEIQSGKEYLEQLTNSMWDTVFSVKLPERVIEWANDSYKLLGYEPDEFIGHDTAFLYANKAEFQKLGKKMEIAIAEEKDVLHASQLLKRKNGEIFPADITLTFHKDNNEVVRITSIVRDITERILLEEAIISAKEQAEEGERKFKAFTNQALDGITVTDLDGNYVFVNPAFCKMSGYAAEELLKLTVFDMKVKNQPQSSFYESKESLEGTPIKVNLKRKDGTEYWTEIIGKNIEIENQKLLLGTIRDITARVKGEEALMESEARFKGLHNASFGGIAIHDKGLILDCNLGLSEISGYTVDELIGMDGLLLIAENSRKMVMENILSAYEEPYESVGLRKDGIEYQLRLEAKEIPFKGKKVRVVEFRDITDQKRVENELIIAKDRAEESDRLKSAFLANMSHEIRTPMNGILGFASLLKIPDLNEKQLRKYVGIIEKSGMRMLNIINDLIDISKIEANQMEINISECNINDQLEYLYTFFKPEVDRKGIELSYGTTLISEKSTINTDKEKFYAILTNLIKNSIKYSDEGSISFGYVKKGEMLEFYVKDTGIGIPFSRQKAIFNRFVQADIADIRALEGAGLGLSISKAYVEMLGGEIWLESEEGKGSHFYFTIPYLNETKEKGGIEPKIDLENIPATKKLKVLIVEDEEFSDTYLTIILKEISNEIFHSTTGIEAIEICKEHPDIDLILMDIKMSGMDGYDATMAIRKFNRDVIIIAQTAYALEGDKEKAIAIGCNDYIAKPVDQNKLLEIIAKHLNK